MKSLIVRTAAWLMLPVLILFSVDMLLRGHNLPGGGFIGGLVAAASIVLQQVARGSSDTRWLYPIDLRYLLPLGVLVAALAGMPGLLSGQAFLTGVWMTVHLPSLGALKVGTPLLFDVGVYMVVVGVTVEVIMAVTEEGTWKPS